LFSNASTVAPTVWVTALSELFMSSKLNCKVQRSSLASFRTIDIGWVPVSFEKIPKAFDGNPIADEELDVIPSKGGGRWLSQSLLEQRQKEVPIIRWSAPKNFEKWSDEARHSEIEVLFETLLKPLIDSIPKRCKSFYGLDFARRSDLCVFWPLIEYQDTIKHCPFVLELSNMPYKQQEQLFKLIAKALPNFSKGAHDATGNGGYLAEAMQLAFGEKVEAIHLSEGWYREHTPHFKAALEDGDIASIPKDKDIMDDHRAFVLVNGVARIPQKRSTGADGLKRHGDSGIAHLLADYASKNPSAPIEFMPIPSKEEMEFCGGYLEEFQTW